MRSERNVNGFAKTQETAHPDAAPFSDGSGRGRSFQSRVHDWIIACFGEEIGADRIERNHRFIEEALELVQSNGCTRSEAHQLVDYVYDRPVGEPTQEVGGVMNTLAALCTASGIDMAEAGETELERVWTKVEKIRAKQAGKPKHSPLPQDVETPAVDILGALNAADEALAMVTAFEDDARYIMGNTNFEIVKLRRAQIKIALSRAGASS